ncbi:MAG: hypothetical protein RL497_675 [Pseudomonadota bacterium]|jgi:glycosyltransferase involved in cell wall biosynthesis
MANKRILIISANGDESTTGYATRVLEIAKTLKNSGNTVKLLRFFPFHHPRSWNKNAQELGIELSELPMPPMSRFSLFRWATVILANLLTYIVAKIWRADALQAESHDAALIALWIKWYAIPVLVDIHGAAPEEAEFLDRHSKKAKNRSWLQLAEKLIVEKSDIHFVVTQEMINHLQSKHTKIKSQAKILPVAVNLEFFPLLDTIQAKNNLGIPPDKTVVAYCGGDQNYQCLDDMKTVLEKLCGITNLHILVISKSTEKFSTMFSSLPCSKTYVSANHDEVHKLLNAADYGLLIRRNELLNHVSCPTKFAEYLACGLAVLTTPWAGHGPSIVQHYKAGLVLDPDAIDCKALEQLLQQRPDRSSLRKIATDNLSWSKASQTLIKCYL